ncbi:hypothetical protein [Suttonella ornithocola]|uniref:Uncharacterized protein n=1 Tax=Suttonella ornithocola TaxID=279832 RepID=A0A380MPB1_9GAMM|nr:hypothetical protein [Suttonella ornithocola]SUO93723.1 Uncharacterised protein [Suttonella ornithocola]
MFGLAVIFVVFVLLISWIIVTLLAIRIGGKLWGTKGRWIGFMLFMGIWPFYWAGEYIYLQFMISHLCKTEGGLKVYVSPEEWRRQIGEEEWKQMYYDDDKALELSSDDKFIFQGKTFHGTYWLNSRLGAYIDKYRRRDSIFDDDYILVDTQTQQVLFRRRAFRIEEPLISGLGVSDNALKFWMSFIQDCHLGKLPVKIKYFENQYNNHDVRKGE